MMKYSLNLSDYARMPIMRESNMHRALMPAINTTMHLILVPVFNLNTVWFVVVAVGWFSTNLVCAV